jgi:hypothetical protein
MLRCHIDFGTIIAEGFSFKTTEGPNPRPAARKNKVPDEFPDTSPKMKAIDIKTAFHSLSQPMKYAYSSERSFLALALPSDFAGCM